MELLFFFAVLWCLFWALVATRSRGFVLLLILLGCIHWVLASVGFYTDSTAIPPRQILLLAPPLVALALVVALPTGRRWLAGAGLLSLTALHILRVPVELVLHQAYEQGLVPRDMTYAGVNPDILSGLSAAFLVAWMTSARPPSKTVLIIWNLACLGLLVNIVVIAVLSLPTAIQSMNTDQPNVLVLRTPYVLLPAVLVPAVLWSHLAALVELVRSPTNAS